MDPGPHERDGRFGECSARQQRWRGQQPQHHRKQQHGKQCFVFLQQQLVVGLLVRFVVRRFQCAGSGTVERGIGQLWRRQRLHGAGRTGHRQHLGAGRVSKKKTPREGRFSCVTADGNCG